MFEFLSDLERSLSIVIKGVGKIDHQFWRSYHTETRTEPSESFVDGDLIESFLDLSKTEMLEVVDELEVLVVYIISWYLMLLFCYFLGIGLIFILHSISMWCLDYLLLIDFYAF